MDSRDRIAQMITLAQGMTCADWELLRDQMDARFDAMKRKLIFTEQEAATAMLRIDQREGGDTAAGPGMQQMRMGLELSQRRT